MSNSRFKEKDKEVTIKAKCVSCGREKPLSNEDLCEACDKDLYHLEVIDEEVKEVRQVRGKENIVRTPLNSTDKQIAEWTLKKLVAYKHAYENLREPVDKLRSAFGALGLR